MVFSWLNCFRDSLDTYFRIEWKQAPYIDTISIEKRRIGGEFDSAEWQWYLQVWFMVHVHGSWCSWSAGATTATRHVVSYVVRTKAASRHFAPHFFAGRSLVTTLFFPPFRNTANVCSVWYVRWYRLCEFVLSNIIQSIVIVIGLLNPAPRINFNVNNYELRRLLYLRHGRWCYWCRFRYCDPLYCSGFVGLIRRRLFS